MHQVVLPAQLRPRLILEWNILEWAGVYPISHDPGVLHFLVPEVLALNVSVNIEFLALLVVAIDTALPLPIELEY